MHPSTRLRFALVAAVLGALALAPSARGAFVPLFYSGDLDPTNPNANGLYNGSDAIVNQASTYENFIVPSGPGWHVTGLFSNNHSGLNPATATWEIRTGLSEGNGGTLVASGTASVTQTPTGRSFAGLTEYQDLVSGLSVDLAPGMYWLNVTPVDPTNSLSYNSNTFGLNAVGTDVQNQQFFNSSFFGANFTNANNFGTFPLLSDGVVGTLITTAVPEPASVIPLLTGALGLLGYGWRKRRQAAA
jgi:hypothetical protein